jgi:hypothetical protein
MSSMLEVLYHAPTNLERESRVARTVEEHGGSIAST